MDDSKTPGGLKVRWKVRVITGPAAAGYDARQNAAIRELLQWACQQPAPQMTGPVEPVPVAFIGRTSTLTLQDPAASLRRQVRECQAKLPPGWYIAAWFWDIESGGLPTDQRGHGSAHEQFAGIGIPRDGGLADLLAEAASPAPRFAARDLRRHRTVRPRHLLRAAAGEAAHAGRDPAVRHRRADRRRRRQRHHRPGAPGQAGRGRVVPAADQGEGMARPA